MKGKGIVWLILALFVLPLGLAKLVLSFQWYEGGQLNRGHLLQTAPVAWLPENNKWHLFYRLPDVCDAACQGALFTLRQLPIAAGANRHRVLSLVVMNETQFAALPSELDMALRDLNIWLIKDEQPVQDALSLGHQAIYLSDPLNSVVLGYPTVTTQSEILAQGKALLADLNRLLKLSRIG